MRSKRCREKRDLYLRRQPKTDFPVAEHISQPQFYIMSAPTFTWSTSYNCASNSKAYTMPEDKTVLWRKFLRMNVHIKVLMSAIFCFRDLDIFPGHITLVSCGLDAFPRHNKCTCNFCLDCIISSKNAINYAKIQLQAINMKTFLLQYMLCIVQQNWHLPSLNWGWVIVVASSECCIASLIDVEPCG